MDVYTCGERFLLECYVVDVVEWEVLMGEKHESQVQLSHCDLFSLF